MKELDNKELLRKVLVITNTSLLENPVRGTPLRSSNFIKQIKKNNIVLIKSSNEDFFKNSRLRKIFYFIRLIKKSGINIIFTPTTSNIGLVVVVGILTGRKIVVDVHGLIAEEAYQNNKFKRFLLNKKIKFYLSFFDLVFVVSNKLKKYYANTNKNIVTIYGGVDLKEFFLKKKKNDVFTIGYMGNSRHYQGLNYLIDALYKIKKKGLFDFKMRAVISNDIEDVVKKIEEKNLKLNVDLYNKIPHEKVNDIISECDALVIPRPKIMITEYAYPSKLSECLATGVPTILTNVGPVEELFEKNENSCYIIDSSNISDGIMKALVDLRSMSEEERSQIGSNAINFVRKKLSWDVLGAKINHHLEKI